jgi:hypothetical protein
MISRNEFWRVIEAYGSGIDPAQFIFYIAGILLVGWLILKPSKPQSFFAELYLSIAFAWNGVVLYMLLARDMAGKTIHVLLLICAIPFTPFVQIGRYGVYKDIILFITGAYGLQDKGESLSW